MIIIIKSLGTISELQDKLTHFEQQKLNDQHLITSQTNQIEGIFLDYHYSFELFINYLEILAKNQILLEEFQTKSKDYKAALNELQDQLALSSSLVTQCQLQIEGLTQKLNNTSSQLSESIEANQILVQTNANSEKTIKQLTIDLEKKKADLIQLESTNEKLIGHNNIKQKVNHVVELKKQNNELQNVC